MSQKKRNAMMPIAATPPTAPPMMAPRGAEPPLLSSFPLFVPAPGGEVAINWIVELEVGVELVVVSSLEDEDEVEIPGGDAYRVSTPAKVWHWKME